MLVNICVFSNIPEGLVLHPKEDAATHLPSRWSELVEPFGSIWERQTFPSFRNFVCTTSSHPSTTATLWLRAAHALTRSDLAACLAAHVQHGAAATTFAAEPIIPKGGVALDSELPPELTMGWENLALSCRAGGKYSCPISPLVLSSEWLHTFATWLQGHAPTLADDLILSDYVSACMGRKLREDRQALRLTTCPQLVLHIEDTLDPTMDVRRRALIRLLCLRAADLHREGGSRWERALNRAQVHLAANTHRLTRLFAGSSHHQGPTIPNVSPEPAFALGPRRLTQEVKAVECFVKSLSDPQVLLVLRGTLESPIATQTVWRTQIQWSSPRP